MKKIGVLFTVIILAVLFAVSASAATEGYYTYEVKNGEATITDVDTSISGDVTIPSTLGGYPVTSIGYMAFVHCVNLSSVTISDGVNLIDDSAFAWCYNLTSITIPDSVTSIGYSAFWDCESLTSITIPESVTFIGENAFYDCTNLINITVDENNKYYSNDSNGVLFSKDKAVLLRYPEGNTRTTYIIPESVTTIRSYAFYHCTGLTSIIIPDSEIYIGQWAFSDCASLTSISIPESAYIGSGAFKGCTGLISIAVDEDNKYYSNDSNGVLFNKDKTELLAYPAGNARTTYIIPDSVTSIGDEAFSHCESLRSITIPDSVTYIGNWAFNSCTSLTSIIIPSGVTSIRYRTFGGCANLNNITIPNSIISIGESAFCGCASLTSIIIPDGVTSIGESAFRDCIGLASTTLPDSLTSIGECAFDGCNSLDDIYYIGSQSQWIEVSIGSYNESLINATIHFNSCKVNFGGHSYISEITTEPTHLTEGVKTNICSACGYSNTESIAKIPHSCSKDVTAPTCAECGYTTYNCECGYSYVGDYVGTIPHSYTSTVTRPATHLSEGVRTYTCSACGDSYSESIAKTKEHSHTASNVVAPTCEKEGYTVYVCECGDTYNGDKKSAKGHNYDGDNCKVCGESKIENCSCKCHKGGIAGFFWKISNFFNKLFKVKSKKMCACGVFHY